MSCCFCVVMPASYTRNEESLTFQNFLILQFCHVASACSFRLWLMRATLVAILASISTVTCTYMVSVERKMRRA